MAGIQEAIRIVLETEGREGIEQLRVALAGLGGVSADSVDDTNRLLDSLTDLNDAAAKMSRFSAIAEDLSRTTEALDDASRAALQLSLQMAETENPSREMVRTYKQVREEVSRLEGVQREQVQAQQRIAAELHQSGVATDDLAQAEAALRARVQAANEALAQQAQRLEAQADGTRRQRAELLEGEEAFRRFARSGQVSAEALEQYRSRARAAADSTDSMGDAIERSRGAFSSLRGLLAGAAAYLGFDAAVSGVKRLLEIGSAAETTRRALGNLYGSQEAGNRAFEVLRTMSARNGVALNDLAETAKKLKAFGLDPLKGSLQALIDQNAAVGGSQEDLEGKALALGQAWAKQKLQGEEILQLVERGVPVWELLQKATGKNVTELQKLSSAGALGRDVIQKLYTEIGKANAGAAAASLGTLSGLLQQVTSNWQAFLMKVADSGVNEFFRNTLRDLIGNAGNLDQVASRVGQSITRVLEQVRSLVTQLAPLGAAIGNVTMFLARHAEAVANTAKAWALFRLAEWALGFARLTTSINGTTAALAAQRAAAVASGGAIAAGATTASTALLGLGGRIAAVAQGLLGLGRFVGWPVAVVSGAYALGEAYLEVNRAILTLEASEARLRTVQADGVRIGQQMQALNRQWASTVIETSGQISTLTRNQAQDYQFALGRAREYYAGVIRESINAGQQIDPDIRAALQRIDKAIEQTTVRLTALNTEAAKQTALRAFADNAVAKFDELVSKGKAAKDAISGLFTGLDLGSTQGMSNAVLMIEQLQARGRDAGKAIQSELRTALAGVADEDLPRVRARFEEMARTGSTAAKLLGDELARINLTKLGVDVEAITTGMTKAGRAAASEFEGARKEVDALHATAQQKSQLIAQAFDNAFRQASTSKEIEALKSSLQNAFSDGSISAVEFQKRLEEANAKLAELSGAGQQLGSKVKEGADLASRSLEQVATAAERTADKTQDAADAVENSSDAMRRGGKDASSYALTMGSVSEAFTRAALSFNRLVNSVSNANFRSQLNRLTADYKRQAASLQAQQKAIDDQLAAYDPLTARVAELRQQYKYLGEDQLRALAEKEKQLADMQQRQLDDAARAQEEVASTGADATPAAAAASVTTRAATQVASATSDVLDQASEAADSIGAAAARLTTASRTSGEVVIRIVTEAPAGAQALRLDAASIRELTAAVLRELTWQKGLGS